MNWERKMYMSFICLYSLEYVQVVSLHSISVHSLSTFHICTFFVYIPYLSILCYWLVTQDFVVRNDSSCGSTIGPIMSAKLGIPTIDVGCPQLSMHSIREMCCVTSVKQATDLFQVRIKQTCHSIISYNAFTIFLINLFIFFIFFLYVIINFKHRFTSRPVALETWSSKHDYLF